MKLRKAVDYILKLANDAYSKPHVCPIKSEWVSKNEDDENLAVGLCLLSAAVYALVGEGKEWHSFCVKKWGKHQTANDIFYTHVGIEPLNIPILRIGEKIHRDGNLMDFIISVWDKTNGEPLLADIKSKLDDMVEYNELFSPLQNGITAKLVNPLTVSVPKETDGELMAEMIELPIETLVKVTSWQDKETVFFELADVNSQHARNTWVAEAQDLVKV